MAKEDLLVNIEVNTKPAKRGVEDLNKSLSENAKQTRKIQDELKRLEKDYKSIATAIKKLPQNEIEQLNRAVRKASKSTSELSDQFERTEKKLDRVKDRTREATQGFAVLAATVAAFNNFQPIIQFTGQIVQASQAILAFKRDLGPLIADSMTRLSKGFERSKDAAQAFMGTFQLVGKAFNEQKQIFQGYQQVQIYGIELSRKFTEAFTNLSSAASFVQRTFVELVSFNNKTLEGFGRLKTLFRTLGNVMSTTGKIVNEFRNVWFGTFGGATGGAAQINRWQQLLLELQYITEIAGKKIVTVFNVVSKTFTESAKKVLPFLTELSQNAAAKGLGLLESGFKNLAPAIIRAREYALELALILDKKLASGVAFFVESAIKGTTSALKFGQEVGFLGKGFLAALDTTNLLGAGMLGLGTALKQTENSFLQTIGSALQMAGVFSISLASGTTILIGVLGSLISTIGDKLLAVTDQWEAKFARMQTITAAFEFTVRGFGKTMGVSAVGSLEKWNDTIGVMVQTTNFGIDEIQKSVKILIAEGAALGLTAEQNAALLKRAGDIAAVTGMDLAHVSLAIARGLAGNAASLQDMGIFLTESALQHSKYAKQQNLVISNLDVHKKAQVALNVLMEQTIPLVGGATNQLNTLAGATKQYQQSIELLQAKLGSTSFFFVDLARAQSTVVQWFTALPDVVFDVVGSFVEILAVTLKLAGMFISMVITITSLKGVFDLLNLAVKQSAVFQSVLNIVLGTVSKSLGIQVIAIKSLKDVFLALGQIAIPVTVAAYRNFVLILTTATARVYAFVASMLFTKAGWITIARGAALATASLVQFAVAIVTNPLFITGSAVIGAIYFASKAFEELQTQIAFLIPKTEALTDATGKNATAIKDHVSIIMLFTRTMTESAKVVVIGWLEIGKALEMAGVGYQLMLNSVKGLFTDTTARTKELAAQKAKLVAEMYQLDTAFTRTFAPKRLEEFNKGVMRTAVALEKMMRGFAGSMKLSDEVMASLKIDVLGDEFDRANEKFRESTKLLNNLRNIGVFKIGAEVIMPTPENIVKFSAGKLLSKEGVKVENAPSPASADDIEKAAIQTQRSALEIQKLRKKGVEDLAKAINDQAIRALELNDREVEAIRAKGTEELKQLAKTMEGQGKLAELRGHDLEQYKKLQAAIAANNEAEAVKKLTEIKKRAAEEVKRILDEANKMEAEQFKILQDLGTENSKLNIQLLDDQDQIVAGIQQQLEATLAIIEEKKNQLFLEGKLAGPLGDKIIADLKKQVELEKQVADMKILANAAANISRMNPVAQVVGNTALEIGKAINAALPAFNKMFGTNIDMMAAETIAAFAEGAGEFFNSWKGFMKGSANLVGGAILGGAILFDKKFKTSSAENVMEVTAAFAKFSGMMGSLFGHIMGVVAKMFDPEFIQKLADALNNLIDKLPDLLMKAFDALLNSMLNFAEKAPGVVDKLMTGVSGMITKLIDAFPALVDSVAAALTNFMQRLPELTGKIFAALPGMIDKFLSIIPGLIDELFKAIPQIITQLIQAIPGIVMSIIKWIPNIVESLMTGIIGAMDEITAAFIDFLIGGGLEKIAGAFLKMLPRLVMAIVNGIINGLKRGLGAIFGGINFGKGSPIAAIGDLPGKLEKGISKLGKAVAKESSQVFKVLDLNAAASAAKRLGDSKNVPDAIQATIELANVVITGLWQKFLDALTRTWRWIWNKVLQPIIQGLTAVFNFVVEKIIGPLVDGLTAVFDFVVEKIIGPLVDGLTAVFDFVVEKILGPLVDGLTAVFDFVVEKIIGPLVDGLTTVWNFVADKIIGPLTKGISDVWKGIGEGMGNLGGALWQGFKSALQSAGNFFGDLGGSIWSALKSGLGGVGNILKNALEEINPSSLLQKMFTIPASAYGKGDVEKALNIDVPFARFAKGGMVPGSALVSGDSILNDRILAMLSPGEAVVPRSVMDDPVLSKLVQSIISGDFKVPGFALGGTLGKLMSGDVGGAAQDVVNAPKQLSPDKMWGIVKDKVFDAIWKLISSNSFHTGGMVPSFAGGGDVPAMLQSGEFVINRQATSSLGAGYLSSLNGGQAPSNTVVNMTVNVEIEASANSLNETYIRTKLIPSVKEEFKKASLRGDFLMSERGLRST